MQCSCIIGQSHFQQTNFSLNIKPKFCQGIHYPFNTHAVKVSINVSNLYTTLLSSFNLCLKLVLLTLLDCLPVSLADLELRQLAQLTQSCASQPTLTASALNYCTYSPYLWRCCLPKVLIIFLSKSNQKGWLNGSLLSYTQCNRRIPTGVLVVSLNRHFEVLYALVDSSGLSICYLQQFRLALGGR